MTPVASENVEPKRVKNSFRTWVTHTEIFAAVLTVGGVLLFVLLRFPYGIYFEGLGTSPEEIKLGYAQMLGQSSALVFTIGLLATAVLLLLPFLIVQLWRVAVRYIGFFFEWWTFVAGVQTLILRRGRDPAAHARPSEDADELLRRFKWLHDPRVVWWRARSPEATARASKIENLESNDVRTPREDRQLRSLKRQSIWADQIEAVWAYGRWIRKYGPRVLFGTAAVSVVIGLPALAVHQVSEVKQCRQPVLEFQGQKIPGLAFTGEPVEVVPVGAAISRGPTGTELFLVGTGEGFHVLYDCKSHAPVRLPVPSYLIITKG